MHLPSNRRWSWSTRPAARPALWWSALLFVLLSAALWTAAAQDDTATFRSDTRLVELHASVVDKNGRLLTNLPQSVFKVYENNVEQPIKLFKREDVPVSLGLVIDNSGSMRDKRKKVEAAALAAVKASNPRDEVTIVNFNDEAYHDVLFTNDIKKMEEGLTRIDARAGTAMRDAISGTLDYMKKKAKHRKQVMLIITDGNDNTSAISLEALVRKAHDNEVLLYFIGLLNEEEKREAKKAERAMSELARASGGTSVLPKDVESVEKVAIDIANEIRNQYIIAYSPLNQTMDGTFRQVRIMVNSAGRPTVRTRTGYYATPDRSQRASIQ